MKRFEIRYYYVDGKSYLPPEQRTTVEGTDRIDALKALRAKTLVPEGLIIDESPYRIVVKTIQEVQP